MNRVVTKFTLQNPFCHIYNFLLQPSLGIIDQTFKFQLIILILSDTCFKVSKQRSAQFPF